MIRKIIACFLLSLPLFAVSQKKDKYAGKAAATITADDMKKHLYKIASKEMEGRDTPSPGLEKAASYIEEYFRSIGLLPDNNGSYRQYYFLYKETMKDASVTLNGEMLKLHNSFQPLTNNYSASMRFSEVVFAGYGINDGDKRNDYKDLNVAGKLVMIADGIPADYKPSGQGFSSPSGIAGKMNAALRLGASAVLIIYNNFPRKPAAPAEGRWSTNGFKASQSLFGFSVSTDVAAKILNEDGKTVMEKIKAGTVSSKTYKAELELSYTGKTETEKVSNVLGLIEGTDKKDEYVVLTAHYDHIGKRNDTTIYYGADDDGSGTTGILELAQAFAEAKKAGRGPRRSILFMTVSGEEKDRKSVV